jgi:hypothetical protein
VEAPAIDGAVERRVPERQSEYVGDRPPPGAVLVGRQPQREYRYSPDA